jgi:hypothetical protein
MFRCQGARCATTIKPGMPSFLVVVETRAKEYPGRSYRVGRDPDSDKGQLIHDPGGVGRETVREERLCERCYLARVAAS